MLSMPRETQLKGDKFIRKDAEQSRTCTSYWKERETGFGAERYSNEGRKKIGRIKQRT